MKFIKASLSLIALVAAPVFAQDSDPMRDLQLGMAGLQEAASNPELLAQLMQDLQDPEMMAEAKKMMDNPAFQKEMKKLSGKKEFKDAAKKSAETMKDPATAAKMEAKYEHMLKTGQEGLKHGAANAMEDAMASMQNPEVMAEMTKMMKDPSFQAQIASMTKDPSFKKYVTAMEEMMQDPAKKRQFQKVTDDFKRAL